MFYISFDKCLKVKVHKLSGRQTNVYIPTLIHHQHLYPIGYLGMFLFRHCKHIVKSSYPKGKKIHKKWRCLSINLQPEYVPRCFKNQMQKKKLYKKKKKYEHSSTLIPNEKRENGSLLLVSQGEEKCYIVCSDVKLCIRYSLRSLNQRPLF